MAAPPLSHHEILALAAPFARAGRHVDLAATQRQERRVAFRPVELPAEAGQPALRDGLLLESFGTGTFRLTRTLTSLDDGLRATVQGLGQDPGALLAQVLAVEPRRPFRRGEGYALALSFELYPTASRSTTAGVAIASATAPAPAADAVLARGEARVDGLALKLTLSPVKGVAAELALEPTAAARPALPQDLLAVLGWNWSRLAETREGWRGRLRVRGNTLRRGERAERAFEHTAAHLARTLAEPPARFHERWRAARWGVFARRALPLLTVVLVLLAAPLLPREPFLRRPGLVTVIFQIPIALIALSFAVQEMAQFEIPPLPRRRTAPTWFDDPAQR